MLHCISQASALAWGLRLNIGAPLTDYKLPMSSVFICRSRPQRLPSSKVNLYSGPGNSMQLETTCTCRRKKKKSQVRRGLGSWDICIFPLHTHFSPFDCIQLGVSGFAVRDVPQPVCLEKKKSSNRKNALGWCWQFIGWQHDVFLWFFPGEL